MDVFHSLFTVHPGPRLVFVYLLMLDPLRYVKLINMTSGHVSQEDELKRHCFGIWEVYSGELRMAWLCNLHGRMVFRSLHRIAVKST